MNTHIKLAGIGIGALALGALYFNLGRPDAAPPPASRTEANHFAFVPSMAGTRPDGDLELAAGDALVVDAELGHLFDYYLAGLGETSLDAIKAEIERELERRLKPAPAAAAKRLLAHYLDYKRALVEIEQGLPATAGITQAARARLAAMQRLRPNYFSAAESAGLFGLSDSHDADAIARLDIGQDASLSPEQKERKLAVLDQQLPAALRERREAPARIVKLEESVQKLRAQGVGDNEIYRMRAAALSPAAADRLAELDRDEAVWKGRIEAYLAERGKLALRGGGPDGQATEALRQLRDSQFTPEEQRRLGAYE